MRRRIQATPLFLNAVKEGKHIMISFIICYTLRSCRMEQIMRIPWVIRPRILRGKDTSFGPAMAENFE
jgi:hypothetical protein